jgi:glycosyltransferase involved in cell wall biosynthesis
MRILLLSPMPPDACAPGAIPAVVDAEVRGLLQRHDVTVVTVAGPERQELEAVRRLHAAGLDLHAVERDQASGGERWARRRRMGNRWLRGRWPLRTVWFWEPRVQDIVDRLTRQRPFEVILAEDNAMGVYRLPERAVRVLTEHEVRRPRNVAPPPASPRQWGSWAWREVDWRRWPRYQRTVWSRYDIVQVFTERDADAVRALAPEIGTRVRVNPFSLTLPDTTAGPVEPDTVVFVGNFTHAPNVDAALWLAHDIMPRLREHRPGVRLAVAGAYAPAAVRALAAPEIHVLGHVDDAEALIRRTAVVLAPVRIGGGMRMKVVQAMGLGKAVVTTTRGADGLTTRGRVPPLAIADDADGIAKLAAALLADPVARAELGVRARAFVAEHHTPEAYVQRLEAVLEDADRHDRLTRQRSLP